MILLLIQKAEAPLLLVAGVARSVRNIHHALRAGRTGLAREMAALDAVVN